MYGTSKRAVRDVSEQNKICILDIDEQGVKNLKSISDIKPIFCFIKPPSVEILAERLKGRGTETEESFNKRMATAKSAIDYADSGAYDCVVGKSSNHWFGFLEFDWSLIWLILKIVNDDLERCYAEFLAFLKSKYPMLNGGGGDANPVQAATMKPGDSTEQTVLTMESSVPGQGGTLNPQGYTAWCTMLWYVCVLVKCLSLHFIPLTTPQKTSYLFTARGVFPSSHMCFV